ncbi:thiamine pyrophosphate-dependent acetolactate synthase large subunit-like protein [Rhodoligotrophos appendicifer]|uniref:5-guanidino-2-oxopentanoate decarboxylase n=1 Tax=Rhodoligotrophos appendicifer TaxID=987056 RepID=UPI001185B385|nr:5-guanidino-2-oxopentanoate decarboxylase [Rhodoligotrophos appendicifer]
MSTLTIGQYLMRLLKAYGVDTVFGIPGVHTLELYRGIASENMRHILVRHEQGAGFMADGYARVTGKPGVCTLITGPGLTNALTPIGQAFSDSIPMLVLSSVNATRELGRGWGSLHEITDQAATARPLVGLSRTAFDRDQVTAYVHEAFNLFSAARPRPAHLELPIDILGADSGLSEAAAIPPFVGPPHVQAADVERAARLLSEAERPLILVGGGAISAHPSLAAMAEALSAPVITTIAGKGIIADRHPLSLGATLPSPQTQKLLAEADVILALGTELAETDHWVDRLQMPGKLIRVDLDIRKLSDLYPAELPLLGEAGAFARDLLAALGRGRTEPWDGRARAKVAAIRKALDEERAAERPEYMVALNALRAALPADTVLATDMTQLAYAANSHFPVDQPRSYLHPCGFGTLGYGLPAAIGAKLGAPERPVAAMVGDGGLLFTLTDLGTAVELEMPLPIILWDNDGLGQIRDGMIRLQMPQIGVSPRNPDYIAVARGFGARAVEVEGPAEIAPAMAKALDHPGPTVLRLQAKNFT